MALWTVIKGLNVELSWAKKETQAVTGYVVYIRDSDGDFIETDLCEAKRFRQNCKIEMSDLWAEPFSLQQGEEIAFKVAATNIVGTSEPSQISE